MSKRRDSLTVSEDLTNIFDRKLERKQLKGLSIEKALSTVIRQMRATGLLSVLLATMSCMLVIL